MLRVKGYTHTLASTRVGTHRFAYTRTLTPPPLLSYTHVNLPLTSAYGVAGLLGLPFLSVKLAKMQDCNYNNHFLLVVDLPSSLLLKLSLFFISNSDGDVADVSKLMLEGVICAVI